MSTNDCDDKPSKIFVSKRASEKIAAQINKNIVIYEAGKKLKEHYKELSERTTAVTRAADDLVRGMSPRSDACQSEKEAVAACYRDQAAEPLKCAELVQCLLACAHIRVDSVLNNYDDR